MTLEEFGMHRPRLAKSLISMTEIVGSVTSVTPRYDSEIMFEAVVEWDDGANWGVAVCLSPKHPMAVLEEEAPGEPTWWWSEDVADNL